MQSDIDKEAQKRFEETNKQMREERWAGQPFENPPFFRSISPAGWKEATGGSIVWEIENYTPGNPITVSYDFVMCIPQTVDDTKKLIERTFQEQANGRGCSGSGGHYPDVLWRKSGEPQNRKLP